MPGPRGLFVAVDCAAHHSPQLAALRSALGSTADAYYYRALQFAKTYQQTGQLGASWTALAGFVLWPDDPQSLACAFRMAGLVHGERDELVCWERWNGWLIEKARKDAKRMADKRRAGRLGARVRRRRTAEQNAQRAVGRLVGSGVRPFANGSRTMSGKGASMGTPIRTPRSAVGASGPSNGRLKKTPGEKANGRKHT